MRTRKLRLLSALLAVAMMFMLVPTAAFADDENPDEKTEGKFKYIVNSDNTATITGYQFTTAPDDDNEDATNYTDTKIEIPNEIGGYTVTAIGDKAFFYNVDEYDGETLLEEVVMPSTITSIGDWAFTNCENLYKLTVTGEENALDFNIPSGVTSIGEDAFSGCAMTSVRIPQGVNEISDGVFSSCIKLKAMDFSESTQLSKIGEGAFRSCEELNDITLPESVESIGKRAFAHCDALSSINIPSQVTEILAETFRNTKIDDDWFRENITNHSAPITSFGRQAFSQCDELKNITIPGSVKNISNAFASCNLENVILEEGVEEIEAQCFTKSPSSTDTGYIKSIYLPKSLKKIGRIKYSGAISGWTLNTKVTYAGTKEDWDKVQKDSGDTILNYFTNQNKINYSGTHTHTVRLDYNGKGDEEYSDETVECGKTMLEPDYTVEGYTLTGWYDENDNKFDFSQPIDKDMTLTAKWEPDTYTVTFHYNGKGGTDTNITVTYPNTTIEEPIPEEVGGYTFDGWYTQDEDGEFAEDSFDFDESITEDTDLYAKWTPNQYAVTFDYNDDNQTTNKTATVAYGQKIAEQDAKDATNATREGYALKGWYLKNAEDEGHAEEAFDFDNSVITKDITLVAEWVLNAYTVKFDCNGMGGKDETQTVNYGDKVTAPALDEVEGYTFDGWYDENNAKVEFNEDGESMEAVTENMTLTAKWTPNTYTVKFDYNGKGGTNSETTVTYPATVAEPTPEKVEGYTFGGWYNGDTKFDFTQPVTENTTLTAKWYRNAAPINPASAYKVTVKGGTAWVKNGDAEEPIEFAEPDQTVIIKADDSSNDGMKFEQWKVNKGTVELKNDHAAETTFVMPAEPVELEAMLVTADTDDSSWDAATIVTGVAIGAGTAVLAYHIGTEVYAEQILGKGVAIPRTRADVALTAWQLAGKPEVAIEGEPLSEAAMAQKWAVESGLMQNDADGSFNPEKKMSKLKALKVLDAAKKMG